jgi:hypothetical protein
VSTRVHNHVTRNLKLKRERPPEGGYRVAFIDAFRERGIVPYDIRRLAEDSLLWEPPPMDAELSDRFSDVLPLLDLTWGLTIERQSAFKLSQKNGAILQRWLAEPNDPKRRLLRQILGFEEPAKRWTSPCERRNIAALLHRQRLRDLQRAGHHPQHGVSRGWGHPTP